MISNSLVARIATVGMALLLAGCVTGTDTSTPSPTPFVRPSLPALVADSPLVLHTRSDGGHGAAQPGRLVLEDDCLYLVAEGSDYRWVPSFPYPGTDWDGTAVVSEGDVIPMGELAVFGGGEIDVDETNAETMDWVKPPDPPCLMDDGKAWLVYTVSGPP